jgi:hypothetical protein
MHIIFQLEDLKGKTLDESLAYLGIILKSVEEDVNCIHVV